MSEKYRTPTSRTASTSGNNSPGKTIEKQADVSDPKSNYKYTIPPMDEVMAKFSQISGIGAELATVPEMNTEDFNNLATAVETDGFLSSVKVNQNDEVLDGRGLLGVAYVLGINPPLEVTDADPLALATANYARRHMTSGQKAISAMKLLPFLKPAAAERRNAALKKGAESPVRNNCYGREDSTGQAVDIAARRTGTSRGSVYRAMKLSPEAAEKVWSGELSLNAAESADRKRKAASATSDDTVTDAKAPGQRDLLLTIRYDSPSLTVYGSSQTSVQVTVCRIAPDKWRVFRTGSVKSYIRESKPKAFPTALSIFYRLVNPGDE